MEPLVVVTEEEDDKEEEDEHKRLSRFFKFDKYQKQALRYNIDKRSKRIFKINCHAINSFVKETPTNKP